MKETELQPIQNTVSVTKRPTIQTLEDILYDEFKVLDHGFVRVMDYMGGDDSIVQAARVSYGKGTKKVNENRNLINYLMKHSHTTPFEMCEIKFHVKLPIFIARQWIRHRTANVNEYSARYSILDKEFYIPRAEDLSMQSPTNKQCRDSNITFPSLKAERILEMLKADSTSCYNHYLEMLNMDPSDSGDHEAFEEKNQNDLNKNNENDLIGDSRLVGNHYGLARELARINLTLNYYTQMYWKIDLHNLLHFLKLRSSPHAQLEIRKYAEIMLNIVSKWVPQTYEAFLNYSLNAVTISSDSLKVLRRIIKGEAVSYENSGLSKREWNEINNMIG